ncbi:hypothetical protein KCP70_03285 [Salmonella enterica subsp. enterica]|nr:hypothetical protein KCP70_03285 [Salmonella enterica subsp. enterica]
MPHRMPPSLFHVGHTSSAYRPTGAGISFLSLSDIARIIPRSGASCSRSERCSYHHVGLDNLAVLIAMI